MYGLIDCELGTAGYEFRRLNTLPAASRGVVFFYGQKTNWPFLLASCSINHQTGQWLPQLLTDTTDFTIVITSDTTEALPSTSHRGTSISMDHVVGRRNNTSVAFLETWTLGAICWENTKRYAS